MLTSLIATVTATLARLYPSYFKLLVRWRPYLPQSLTCVSSWEFARLPPSRNPNYLGYNALFHCKPRSS
ncbi:hypothetical protein EO763_07215 [Pectobacterium odoriferum]|nr:hypothetical protein EO763_07215 [Pectobacterium odoriferum]